MGHPPQQRGQRVTSASAAASAPTHWGPADAEQLNQIYAGRPLEALRDVLTDPAFGPAAIVSSFGADSAVLLHLAAGITPAVPVLFVETGWLFSETLAYAEALAAHLRLRDVRWLQPDAAEIALKDPKRLRWSYDPDGCCAVRKVAPLDAALAGFAISVSGRKRHQAATRANLQLFEADGPRLKLNPLLDWSAADIAAHAAAHALPPHPLVAEGYPSIGCSPCTSRVQPGEDPRAGRWRGWDKVECGIHSVDPTDDPAF